MYFVIRNKNTGMYFRGRGANRWGKYFNQASIYRVYGQAESSLKDINRRHEEDAEIVPIKIELVNELPEAYWELDSDEIHDGDSKEIHDYRCSSCKGKAMEDEWGDYCFFTAHCPHCGIKMKER